MRSQLTTPIETQTAHLVTTPVTATINSGLTLGLQSDGPFGQGLGLDRGVSVDEGFHSDTLTTGASGGTSISKGCAAVPGVGVASTSSWHALSAVPGLQIDLNVFLV